MTDERPTRDQVLIVECPVCGAQPGDPCVYAGVEPGTYTWFTHMGREVRAIEQITEEPQMSHLTTVTIPDADAAREHLLAVGTKAPTLHPHVNSDDPWERWNGWNKTRAAGMDANGEPLLLEAKHYAAGGTGYASVPVNLLSDDHNDAWSEIAFPLEMLPAVSVILAPEHTPKD